MKLVLHRRVRSDVEEIMDYYEGAGNPELAQDFYSELRGFMLEAAQLDVFYVARRGYNRAPMKTRRVVVRRMTA